MNRRVVIRLALAALLAAAGTMPARAGTTSVTRADGVILSYTATVSDLGGGQRSMTINFDDTNLVSKINGAGISPKLNADFPSFLSTILSVTPSGGGNYAVSLSPSPGGKFGVESPGQVLFDFAMTKGDTSIAGGVEGLTLQGSAALDPLTSTKSVVKGSNTYNFSPFTGGGSMILTLNSGDDLIGALVSGSGTFAGTASFTLVAVPEPGTVFLAATALGATGLSWVRRRKVN